MADLDIRIRLATEGGKASAEQINLITEEVERARKDVALFTKQGGIGAIAVGEDKIRVASAQVELLGSELVESATFAARLRSQLEQIDPRVDPTGYSNLQRQIISTETTAARLRQELSQLPRDLREQTADSVGYLGDIDSSLQALAGTLTSIGSATGIGALGTAGKGLALGGDIFAAAEAVPRLASAAQQLQSNVVKVLPNIAAQITANNALAASAAATVAPLGGTAASLTAIAVAAAPFVAVGAALGGAYVLLDSQLNKNAKAVEQAINAERNRIDALRTTRDILESLSGAEITGEIEALQRNISEEESARDALVQQLQDLYGESSYAEILNELGRNNKLGIVGDVFDAIIPDGDGLSSLVDEIKVYNTSLDEQQRRLDALNEAQNEALLRDATIASTKELIRVYEEQIQKETEYANLLRSATVEGTQDQIERLRDEIAAREKAAAQARELAESLEVGSDAYRLAQDAYIEQTNAIDDLVEEQQFLTREVLQAAEAREREAQAIQDSTDAIQEAEALRVRVLEEGKRSRAEVLRINEQITDLEAERAKQLEDQAREESRRLQENGLLDQIGAARQREAQQAAQNELVRIREQSATQEVEIAQKAAGDINKLNADFMRDEIRAIQDFNRERERLERDTENNLLAAAQANDVNAFIRTRQQAVTQLADSGEDFAIERGRTNDDRLRRIREIEETRDATIQARQESTREQILQIQQQSQQVASESQRLETQLQQLKAQFAAEDRRLQLAEQKNTYDARLDALHNQRDMTINAYREMAQREFQAAVELGKSIVSGFYDGATSAINDNNRRTGGLATRAELQIAQKNFAAAMRFAGRR